MQLSDWKMIRTITIVIGIITFVIGSYIWINFEGYMGLSAEFTARRYNEYIVPLVVVGISFLVIGLASHQRITTDSKQLHESASAPIQLGKYCKACGKNISLDAKFCSNCGQTS